MSLSCYCSEVDSDCAGWFWYSPEDFEILKTKRAKRCCSCKSLIKVGDECLKFDRFRFPQTDIEIKIYGEGTELPIANWYMCSECGEIFFNLSALEYCINIEENMHDVFE